MTALLRTLLSLFRRRSGPVQMVDLAPRYREMRRALRESLGNRK